MKVGDVEKCVDCGGSGVVVTTTFEGHDLDRELARRSPLPLEPSVYEPAGLTCRPCEAIRLRQAMPKRGVCPACGKENLKATLQDMPGTRSFCDDACLSEFVNRGRG